MHIIHTNDKTNIFVSCQTQQDYRKLNNIQNSTVVRYIIRELYLIFSCLPDIRNIMIVSYVYHYDFNNNNSVCTYVQLWTSERYLVVRRSWVAS